MGDFLWPCPIVCGVWGGSWGVPTPPGQWGGVFLGGGKGLPKPCLNWIRTPASFWIFLIISPLRPMTTPTECRGTGTWGRGLGDLRVLTSPSLFFSVENGDFWIKEREF